MRSAFSRLFTLSIVGATMLLAACAGTAPKPELAAGATVQFLIDQDDNPEVKVEAAPDVEMLTVDKQRLASVIADKVDHLRVLNPADGDPRHCIIDVTITRYKRGNAFARAMVAGLGQIHIDATVHVSSVDGGQALDDFKISKTFAWGGIYGAVTSMEEIERTFAEGLAEALTGQNADTKKGDAKKADVKASR